MTCKMIDAFGTDQHSVGPPYCRISAVATEGSQENPVMACTVKLDGVTADVNEVVIQCTRDQLQSENYITLEILQ